MRNWIILIFIYHKTLLNQKINKHNIYFKIMHITLVNAQNMFELILYYLIMNESLNYMRYDKIYSIPWYFIWIISKLLNLAQSK